jgi:polygalacturonase
MRYLFFLLLLLSACSTARFTSLSASRAANRSWRDAAKIARRVQPPVFPARDFPVLLEPNAGLRIKNCRSAIQNAISVCHAAGGGRVVIPAGNYLCDGPIHLRSNVNLHLQKGATLVFDTIPSQYLPLVKVRWEGTVCWNYSPLIYAFQQKNIALTGEGIINGQSLSYWKNWRARQDPAKKRLRQMGSELAPEEERHFGEGYWLRPSLVAFYECENILVEGLTLQESPFWTLHPVFSKNITCRKLTITGGFLNDDGIDPDSCEDVLIEDCDIHTDDDAISVKAGRDQDAWHRLGTRRILVRRCTLYSEKANALCIGSELSGGVKEVFFEDCTIRYARYGINFKTNNDRGGFVKNIYLRNIKADTCSEHLLFFQTNYHSYRGGNFPTEFRDFYLQNIDCQKVGASTIRLNGLPSAPIRRVFLDHVTAKKAGQPPVVEHTEFLIEK